MYFNWKIGYGGGVVSNQTHPTRRPYHWLLFHLWQQAMRYHGDQSRQLWNLAYSQRCDREVRDTFLFLQIPQNKWYLTWLSGIFLLPVEPKLLVCEHGDGLSLNSICLQNKCPEFFNILTRYPVIFAII